MQNASTMGHQDQCCKDINVRAEWTDTGSELTTSSSLFRIPRVFTFQLPYFNMHFGIVQLYFIFHRTALSSPAFGTFTDCHWIETIPSCPNVFRVILMRRWAIACMPTGQTVWVFFRVCEMKQNVTVVTPEGCLIPWPLFG